MSDIFIVVDFSELQKDDYVLAGDFIPPIDLNKCRWLLVKLSYSIFLNPGVFPATRKVSLVTTIRKSGDIALVL